MLKKVLVVITIAAALTNVAATFESHSVACAPQNDGVGSSETIWCWQTGPNGPYQVPCGTDCLCSPISECGPACSHGSPF